MSNGAGTLEALVGELTTLLAPLADLTPQRSHLVLLELGITITPQQATTLSAAFGTTTSAIGVLIEIESTLQEAIENEQWNEVISKCTQATAQIRKLISGASSIALAIDNLQLQDVTPQQIAALPDRLVSWLMATYFGRSVGVNELLQIAGILTRTYHNVGSPDPAKPFHTTNSFEFGRISGWLSNPGGQLEQLYDWGKPTFGPKLLGLIDEIVGMLGFPTLYDPNAADLVLDLLFVQLAVDTGSGAKRGLEVRLRDGVGKGSFEVGATNFTLTLSNDFEVPSGTTLVLTPSGVSVIFPDATKPSGNLSGNLAYKRPSGPLTLLSVAGGSKVTVEEVWASIVLSINPNGNAELELGADLKRGNVLITMENADGFIGEILGGFKVESNFDLGMGFSIGEGIYFHGSGGLEIQLPSHTSLGPVEVKALTLSVGIAGLKFPAKVTVDLKASLGPLTAVVEGIGFKVETALVPDNSGILGPLDFRPGFKPPNRVGLSVDAGIVKGGGYLDFDLDKQEYAGIFELSIAEIVTVKAIGLITTKMPDGSKGFSLLIILTAEFGAGIQLGYGFTLLGVGGLLGLNRTMMIEPIGSGIRSGAINSIMFPPDPVANASRIISDLRAYFPVHQGKFLIGPMLKLGWGTPTMVSLSVCLIIEIPGDVAIVGILRVVLPAEEAPLLVINVGFVGKLEFDKKRVWFFASMFDSRILSMTMEGDMGLLMDFSDNPNFVLSVGGFHPQFNPPPLPFPNPRRIHMDVLRNPLQRITVENYFAVTANTVQLGARAEIFYGIDEFNLHGNFSFDALFQFSPFHFIIEMSFSVGMDVFGAGVFSVQLRLLLSGPAPWLARGTATLSIDLWLFSIDISVDFNISWGEADNPKLPTVEAIPILVSEFNKSENWRARLPQNANILVSLRKLDSAMETLVLHPLGTLRISQRAVPLGVQVDKIGNSPVSDAHVFEVRVSSIGLDKTNPAPTEKFAIGQFQNLSDANKLSSPSFQDLDSGVELAFSGRQFSSRKIVKRVVRYEVKIMDGDDKYLILLWFKNIGTLFYHWLGGAAVSSSPLSFARKKSMVPTQLNERIKVGQPGYVLAGIVNNKVVSDAPIFATEAQARDFLNSKISKDPGVAEEIHVIPKFEAAS